MNPDEDGDTTISSFPISLEYQWEILAFLRSFNLQNFSFTPDAFFNLGLQIFRISQEQVIAQTLNYFIDPEDYSTSKFQILIDDINNSYPDADLVLPPDEEVTVELVAQMISQNPNIRKLRIWGNGNLKFQGDGLVVPKLFRLKVGPVKLVVTIISNESINIQLEAKK